MKRLFFLLCGISLYSFLTAQHAGNIHQQQTSRTQHLQQAPVQQTNQFAPPTLDPNYFYVNVKVLYNQVPDAFLAIFNVMQLGKDAEDANAQMGTRIEAILEGLAEIGVPRTEVFIDMISQIPIYEYEVQKKVFSKTYQEIPAGIELQKNLHVRFKDGNLMEKIVRLMAQQEVFELVKVDYLIKDQGKILQEVRKAALEYSQEEIKSYRALGVQYDTLPVLFNDSRKVIFPLTRYMSYPSKASSSLKEKIKDPTQVKQVRTPKVVYYQALPTDDYSVVINPLENEPCVQFHYELMLRYQLHIPQPQVRVEHKTIREKEYIILTPDGNTRTLELTRKEEKDD